MKLSELRPCDACGGPLLKPGAATFHVVQAQQAMINPTAANQVAGLGAVWGQDILRNPRALRLAEAMAPAADDAVMLLGEKEPALKSDLFLCLECATPIMLIEERANARKAAAAPKEGA